MINFEEQGPKISDAEVAVLEGVLGQALPAKYRRFLLDNNGGLPEPDVVDVPGLPGSPTDIQVFFGLSRAIESSCLGWNRDTFRGRLDDGLLPVACDSGGNLFCLVTDGSNAGAVVYCDVDSVSDAAGVRAPAYPVSSDFESFLKAVRRA